MSSNVDSARPFNEAEALLTRFGITAIPVPVDRIAKQLGIQVRYSPLNEEMSGMIFIQDGAPIIGINSMHHPNRQRFTIAHEIGHYQLHRDVLSGEVHVDKGFPILMRDPNSATGEELREVEANRFASAILMPRAWIATVLQQRFDIDDPKPLEEWAKKFRVSKQALEYRIRNAF